MFISEISITNFRCFLNSSISFNEGINVIIGANNSGKSNLLKALGLLFDKKSSKTLTVDDFNKNVDVTAYVSEPPKITITAMLSESNDEVEYSEDIATVGGWLINLDKPYTAQITYEFFLPENILEDYRSRISRIRETDRFSTSFWHEIEHYFIKKYVYKVFVGKPNLKIAVDASDLKKFDFQFLDAIRDVDRDLFSGKNALLKDIIDYFLDFDIKSSDLESPEKAAKIFQKKQEFSTSANQLLLILHERMTHGKKEILKYAEQTGASLGKLKPTFEGTISDSDLYTVLKLIVEYETGVKLPATHNGLGYNNLIYISLLLARMQISASAEYYGENSTLFPILVIEEPEAHLHPSMQYKFLMFLNENLLNQVKQVFITSHSPNITSAVPLEKLIVLNSSGNSFAASYPGKVFLDKDKGDDESKLYVDRFLDVTKSDMLFANKVIFVEGIAEQILLPAFARKLGISLEDHHVTIVNVGGRYFNHFAKLFGLYSEKYALKKKLACITDLDPVRKKKDEDEHFQACFPFELFQESEAYDYLPCGNSFVLDTLALLPENIKVFSQEIESGKTFEYELALCNHVNENLLTDSIKNKEELLKIIRAINNGSTSAEIIKLFRTSKATTRIATAITSVDWTEDKKNQHLFAARFLSSIDKGSYASSILNLLESPPTRGVELTVPKYIDDAIKWVCQ